ALEILFQYSRNRDKPDLSEHPLMSFEDVSAVAEVSEKYFVFAAMEVCKIHMRVAILKYPLEVLTYASRHRHDKIYNKVAPRTIDSSAQDLSALGGTTVIPWV
ncbi:hypothetical protein FIBSPDRAFT_688132, partial [Athelia psychrophila]